jgi:hypothetical protein
MPLLKRQSCGASPIFLKKNPPRALYCSGEQAIDPPSNHF